MLFPWKKWKVSDKKASPDGSWSPTRLSGPSVFSTSTWTKKMKWRRKTSTWQKNWFKNLHLIKKTWSQLQPISNQLMAIKRKETWMAQRRILDCFSPAVEKTRFEVSTCEQIRSRVFSLNMTNLNPGVKCVHVDLLKGGCRLTKSFETAACFTTDRHSIYTKSRPPLPFPLQCPAVMIHDTTKISSLV